MRRALLITTVLLVVASMAFAQAGSIGLFADTGGASCNLVDAAGILYVYIVHVYCAEPGALGSRFAVDYGAHAMVKLSETVTPPYLGIGTTEAGISVAYINCIACPNMIVQILFQTFGNTPTCTKMQVIDDPTHPVAPGIYVVLCDDTEVTGTGGAALVNPDETCMCDVPVEDTSWGQIKALYQ